MRRVVLASIFGMLISFTCFVCADEYEDSSASGIYAEFNTPKIAFDLDLELSDLSDKQSIRLSILSETFPRRSLKNKWVHAALLNSEKSIIDSHTESFMTLFSSMNETLRAGDQLVLMRTDSGTRATINGYEINITASAQFFDVLLGALLGEVPYDASLKNQLMKSVDQTQLAALYLKDQI